MPVDENLPRSFPLSALVVIDPLGSATSSPYFLTVVSPLTVTAPVDTNFFAPLTGAATVLAPRWAEVPPAPGYASTYRADALDDPARGHPSALAGPPGTTTRT